MDVIIPVGYAFFERKKYSNPAVQRLLIMKRKEVLYKNKWAIYEEGFAKKWAPILENMLEGQAITLDLDNNRFPGIIDCLTAPKFTRLKELNLENNCIVTVERLVLMGIPEVQSINLQMNQISSIKSFRKNGFKCLKYLNLSNNNLTQLDYISEFSNNGLGKLLLQWNDNRVQSQDISWIAKLNINNLIFIRMESKQRIDQKSIDRMALARYPKARLWRYGQQLIRQSA